MNRRQEFIDWARKELKHTTELGVQRRLKNMNTFYLWVFDHISVIHMDYALDVEAWGVVSAAKAQENEYERALVTEEARSDAFFKDRV